MIFSCGPEKPRKTGKELVNERCAPCHNYSEAHSDFLPSLFGMNEMGAGFKPVYEKILNDTIHLPAFRELTQRDKKEIYHFIMSNTREVTDPKIHK